MFDVQNNLKYSLNINFYIIKFIICLCVYSKYLRKKVFDACYQFNDQLKYLTNILIKLRHRVIHEFIIFFS